MGAHLTGCEDDSMRVLCESMNLILQQTDGLQTGIALETTAGQGTCLGRTFEQIAQVVAGCKEHPRIGVCLDTCHIYAAGYDIRSEETYAATFGAFQRVIGFDKLKLIHANDSKKPLGSRVDRHEHVGDGEIGLEAFRRVANDPRMFHVPLIVETPDADTMHAENVRRLKALVKGSMGKAGEQVITVTVHVFGHYKDLRPEAFVVRMPDQATVTDLSEAVVREEPKLAGLERICRAAVNEEYAESSRKLQNGDVVAFIPPMSGG
jgi:molybdopterin converting factor small subunit